MATNRLLTLLNVRPTEVWLVKRLFWLQFFQGIALAFYFTSTYAEFLHYYPVTELWKVFVYSAFLLWVFGFIYSKVEHAFSIEKVSIYTTIFMAVSMLAFRLIEGHNHDATLFYWSVAWFNVLYLYNNFEFWGIASLLFNVRQSKRLFGVISAGEIPAKLIGYTLASLVVGYVGTANLMLAGVLSMLLSLPFLVSIARSGKIQHIGHDTAQHVSSGQVKTLIKKFTVNKLIRLIAILSLVVSLVDLLISYAFYGEVKKAGYSDVELAQFIAIFMATARFASLFFRLIVTGRIIESMGVKFSLLLTPIVLLLLIFSIFAIDSAFPDISTVFYALGITYILLDILKSSVHTPILLSIIQPLQAHDRLRAHNVVKGIMDPFAFLIAGTFIFGMLTIGQKIYWNTILITVLFTSAIWLIMVFRVNRQYFITLFNNLSSRSYHPGEFNLINNETLNLIKEKLKYAPSTEVVHMLRILRGSNHTDIHGIVNIALRHTDEEVQKEALLLAEFNGIENLDTEVLQILENKNAGIELRLYAAKVYTSITKNTAQLTRLMDYPNEEIRKVVIANMIQLDNVVYQRRSIEKLQGYITSKNIADKIYATEALENAMNDDGRMLLIKLLKDENPDVVKAAIQAGGINAHTQILEALLVMFHLYPVEIIKAFQQAKEKAIPYIKRCIMLHITDRLAVEKLIALCGRIKGPEATELLIDLLESIPQFKDRIIRALVRCNYKASGKMMHKTDKLINECYQEVFEILHMQRTLQPGMDSYSIMNNSLQLELNTIRDTILNLFTFIYSTEHIEEVRQAFIIDENHRLANAFELLEMNVSKHHAHIFALLFEKEDLDHRLARLSLPEGKPIRELQDVFYGVLDNKQFDYMDWTKSCSLYTGKKNTFKLDKDIVTKYTKAEHPVLKETAIFALS